MSGNVGGRGTVLPAGTIPAQGASLTGVIQVEITAITPDGGNAGRVYATCVYPDGFSRDHQVTEIPELVVKITNQLRSRYGVKDVRVLEAPQTVANGGVIKLEV